MQFRALMAILILGGVSIVSAQYWARNAEVKTDLDFFEDDLSIRDADADPEAYASAYADASYSIRVASLWDDMYERKQSSKEKSDWDFWRNGEGEDDEEEEEEDMDDSGFHAKDDDDDGADADDDCSRDD